METHEFFFWQTKLRKDLTKISGLGKSMAVKNLSKANFQEISSCELSPL